MYGAQTVRKNLVERMEFENDVEMYGAQTPAWIADAIAVFENDVEMYGAQTVSRKFCALPRLRMM